MRERENETGGGGGGGVNFKAGFVGQRRRRQPHNQTSPQMRASLLVMQFRQIGVLVGYAKMDPTLDLAFHLRLLYRSVTPHGCTGHDLDTDRKLNRIWRELPSPLLRMRARMHSYLTFPGGDFVSCRPLSSLGQSN